MTTYMIEALDQLPAPAALFECPGGAFLGNNKAARNLQRRILPDVPTSDVVGAFQAAGLDQQVLQATMLDGDGTYMTHGMAGVGTCYMTRLRAPTGLPRPDLLLVTAHPDLNEYDAWLDHQRLAMSVRINENGEATIRAIQTTMSQLQTTLSVQADMINSYNQRMSSFMHEARTA